MILATSGLKVLERMAKPVTVEHLRSLLLQPSG